MKSAIAKHFCQARAWVLPVCNYVITYSIIFMSAILLSNSEFDVLLLLPGVYGLVYGASGGILEHICAVSYCGNRAGEQQTLYVY